MVRNILFYFKYIAKTTLSPNAITKTYYVTINSLQNFETSVSLLNQTMLLAWLEVFEVSKQSY